MNTASHPSAEWTRAAERGSPALMRFIVWLSLRLGRAPARLLLPPVAAYFFVSGARARRATGEYLRRCLGRAPTLAEHLRLFLTFAATLHDRVFLLRNRFDLFDIELHGEELFDAGGALLMGAHFGSFEAMRACGRGMAGRRVVMAMYEENAHKVNAILTAVDPGALNDVVALGRMESMLALRERLEGGALVGFLADRTLGAEPTIEVPFFGAPAAFPTGPMRVAAALRQRVLFMVGLYRGGNRYEIRFEPLADFTGLGEAPRAERDRLVAEAVAHYARRLEQHCRAAPDNWFNFHDFWRRAA